MFDQWGGKGSLMTSTPKAVSYSDAALNEKKSPQSESATRSEAEIVGIRVPIECGSADQKSAARLSFLGATMSALSSRSRPPPIPFAKRRRERGIN